jgi:hypothetical protein
MNRSVLNAMLWAGVVLVAMALASKAAFHMSELTYSKHEKRVLEFAKRKELEADLRTWEAEQLMRQRDSLAVVASEKQKTITRRIESVREVPVPAEAKPLVDTLNAIIDDQNELLVIQGTEIRQGREIEAKLRGALSASNARGDTLQAFIERPQPKPRRWGLTVGAGHCVGTNGTQVYNGPCLNVSVSWRII